MDIDVYRVEQKRKILNLILIWSLGLSSVGLSINVITLALTSNGLEDAYGKGIGILPILATVVLFAYLVYLSNSGRVYIASFICVLFYATVAMYLSMRWGIDIPQGLLIYTLVIVTSWILLDTRTSYIITSAIISMTFLLTYLNTNGYINPNTAWKLDFIDYRDSLIYSVTFSIIALVSWLSNREIERSLAKAAASERALRAERDNLELRVEQRTKELQELQMEKMEHTYRFAEFGKLAAGLMHDIVNPLTVVSINLEHMYSKSEQSRSREITSLKRIMKRAIESTLRIENYVEAARKQIQQHNTQASFEVCKELQDIKKLFAYRSRRENVRLDVNCSREIQLFGNQVKFSQVISNIVTNSFDAHLLGKISNAKFVSITVTESDTGVRIDIQDNGPGISEQDVKKVFQPFFTTKPSQNGTGLGLAMAKDVIEVDLRGSITCSSKLKKGTTFTLEIPNKSSLSDAS